MDTHADLDALEREAYRASTSDGIIDLYAGLSLAWIGIAWIWLPDIAALAGLLPAVLVTPMLGIRQRFVEARLGYVRWRAPRRRWERRNLWLLLGAGVTLLTLGVLAVVIARSGVGGTGGLPATGPGLLAWLLALAAIGLAVMLSAPRMVAYALVLTMTGAAAVVVAANPGWPLLISGLAVTFVGARMVWRFVHDHPARAAS